MRELQNLRKQVKWHSYLNQEMKERRTREQKENGKEIIARNISLNMVRSFIFRNLHQNK